MPKKPFSGKQKKAQLSEKRERKKERDGNLSGSDDEEPGDDSGKSVPVPVAKVNQQPSSRLPGQHQERAAKQEYDPNRYRLHFYRESKEEIKLRKEKAALPIEPVVSEKDLEMSLKETYQPGSALDMPKRPRWDYSMSKADLEGREQKYFRDYVEKIFQAHKDSEDLAWFELNLETWRQLWRVMEMSDIFLVIADLRFPVLHFPPTLFNFITEELKKPMILVLNKIDFVPAPLAIAWKKYFEETYPSLKVVLFGSAPRAAMDVEATFKARKPTKRRRYRLCFGAQEIFDICKEFTQGKVDLKNWKKRLDAIENGQTIPEFAATTVTESAPEKQEQFANGTLTIGCIGEPNVGKSSVINALMGTKVVSVSKTPGHTKHFQTIFLAPNVKLCDCPGLVFPATAPKVLQILGGIYPISQVSDPYSVVGYLAARLPLVQLLKLKHPDEDNHNGKFSALEICEAWAMKRGFYTAKAARPDVYRAANHLLRVTMEGKICMRMFPPGYTDAKEHFAALPETKALLKKLQQVEARLNGLPGDSENSSDESIASGESTTGDLDDSGEEKKPSKGQVWANNPFAALDNSSD